MQLPDGPSPELLSKRGGPGLSAGAHDGAPFAPPHGLSVVRPSAHSYCLRAKGLEEDSKVVDGTLAAAPGRCNTTERG